MCYLYRLYLFFHHDWPCNVDPLLICSECPRLSDCPFHDLMIRSGSGLDI